MELNNLKPAKGSTHHDKRIGRGAGSGHGGTATRGHKGAQSRSGYSRKLGFEGGQMPLQRRLPKFGFTNLKRVEFKAINLSTIEELAALLDVPADELQKTIDRYNELCDQGTDADFGKKSAYMHKIEKAPFWGVRKHIRVSSIDSGVNTNANGQALDADGKLSLIHI